VLTGIAEIVKLSTLCWPAHLIMTTDTHIFAPIILVGKIACEWRWV